jgi:stearoyl-CoA desaturase (delta-9 desaturase)
MRDSQRSAVAVDPKHFGGPHVRTAREPWGAAPSEAPLSVQRERHPFRIPAPDSIDWSSIQWAYVIGVAAYHLIAILAFLPWFFSWSGVVLAFASLYCCATLGINLCYHRLLTHQGLIVPKWFEHTCAILGVCSMQDTPARWVAVHRMHHQYSDEQPDPHSPLVTFLWGHLGWLFVENKELGRLSAFERYSRDVLRDPFYLQLERNRLWVWINLAQAGLVYLVGFTIGWGLSGRVMGGVQFGASLTVWGVAVRTVYAWHATWSVNSVAHLWGYQTYATHENSRNNWIVALATNGEGWHNNHHADQRSARHGHRWWELDVTWLTIRALEAVGLAREVVPPNVKLLEPLAVKPSKRVAG